ncbi:endonuclease V-like [Rhopilema esculentum]|uniref:endonuclease V-like n=1 Tax=Rhopilema esculentum TaxID=499914 RepID=UPI0031D510E7
MDLKGKLIAQLEQWNKEQKDLKEKLIIIENKDSSSEAFDVENIKLVGGVDISFAQNPDDKVHACAALVVISLPDLKVEYQSCTFVHLTSPYIPEYLAFREASYLVCELGKLKQNKPELFPQVLLVDGNGLLHPRGFGVACHIGVLADLPTVGVAKQLFHVGGLEKNEEHTEKISTMLVNAGDSFQLMSESNTVLGEAFKSTQDTRKPIYISVGHKISLHNAVKIVGKCCKYRIPEPVRQADIISREYMRNNYEILVQDCQVDWKGISKQHEEIEELAKRLKMQSIVNAVEVSEL